MNLDDQGALSMACFIAKLTALLCALCLHLDIHGTLSLMYGCHLNSADLRAVLES